MDASLKELIEMDWICSKVYILEIKYIDCIDVSYIQDEDEQ